MKLALVTIVTANLEPMRTFCQEVLQIEPQTYRGNYVEFTLESGTLALWRQSEYETCGIAPMRGAANHSVLIEMAVENVDGEYARLKGLPIEWVQELMIQPWGHRAFYVRDPDGNVLNFHTVMVESRGCARGRGALIRRQSHHVLAGFTPSSPGHGVPASCPTPGEG